MRTSSKALSEGVAAPSARVASPRGRELRRLVALSLGVLGVALVLGLSVALGAVPLAPGEVFAAVLGREDGLAGQIVRDIRLPRALAALGVGASLAVAGVLLQGMSRNPLADPQILGFSSAGALAAVLASVQYPDLPAAALPPIAIAGSLAGAAAVHLAAWRGGSSPVRLALAGVMLASLFTSFTALVLVTSDLTTQAALSWLAGGLFGRGWAHVRALLPWAAGGLLAAALLMRALNILSLGDDPARALGLRVERTRLIAAVLAAVLSGVAVAAAGQVAFVGLVSPHLGRMLVGSDHRFALPMAALSGAVLLGLSDLIARLALSPVEIPVGVVTAAVGVPFFLYLLRTRA